jgi:hypothetical protein
MQLERTQETRVSKRVVLGGASDGSACCSNGSGLNRQNCVKEFIRSKGPGRNVLTYNKESLVEKRVRCIVEAVKQAQLGEIAIFVVIAIHKQ